MSADVECYAGSMYPERPKAFGWGGRRYEVVEIIRRRQEPEGVGFLVRCTPEERRFDLFYNQTENQWQITPKGANSPENSSQFISEKGV